MAKILVHDELDGTRVPFLRGILTRSLADAGMDFSKAHRLATRVREELNDRQEITADDLRDLVEQRLENLGEEEVLRRYRSTGMGPETILVSTAEGQVSAFSQFEHQRCLESCGIGTSQAVSATNEIFEYLRDKGYGEISSSELARITYERLLANTGEDAAHRYLVWVDHRHSGRPLMLLIGGTTGSGKSTLATAVAHRLNIVRTQSTDMLREVMRMMVPERLLPVLHTSAYAAWTALPSEHNLEEDPEAVVGEGYMAQSNLVGVPCEAVLARALDERVSMVLEGVHVHPMLLERIDTESDAIVVPVMLAVLKESRLRRRLRGRKSHAPARATERHLRNLDAIWNLQSFLLSEADRAAVPIVDNDDKDETVDRVLRIVIETLSREFRSEPDAVFSAD